MERNTSAKEKKEKKSWISILGICCFFVSPPLRDSAQMYSSFAHNTGNFLLDLHRNQNEKWEEIMGLPRTGALKET